MITYRFDLTEEQFNAVRSALTQVRCDAILDARHFAERKVDLPYLREEVAALTSALAVFERLPNPEEPRCIQCLAYAGSHPTQDQEHGPVCLGVYR